ncbi:hypothetical protein DFH07DRAFT_951999 [Mycena maculata]|uniref:Pesticidal crystal protein cry6Aa n=1 Tax=Mycena maculata TaxID=230809 RepID=A0AAD7K0E6_9AGAR|nr:hypothetical protein DFH07DRAFT_951999 [Mycena maculata]
MPDDIPQLNPGDVQEALQLQTRDMYNLLRYLWTGTLLPQNAQDFEARTEVTAAHYAKYKADLDAVVKDYTVIASHCKKFKDITYPSIVKIASNIYDYADTASGGGDVEAAYYAAIVTNIHDLAEITDQASPAAKKLAGEINGIIDAMMERIDALQADAAKVKKDLSDFEEECKKDQTSLDARVKAVKDKITTVGGDIDQLQKKIKDDMAEIIKDQEEIKHDNLIMYTSASYAWCTILGAVAALTADIIYAIKKKNTQKAIDELNKKLTEETKELQDDKAIVAQLDNVKLDIQAVIDQIGPAIKTIEKMEGEWGATTENLANIKKYVQNDIKKLSVKAPLTVSKTIVHKWLVVRDDAKRYVDLAYVSDVRVTTFEDYTKELAKKVVQF